MSNISKKISSIEADDDVVSKALGLRPVVDDDLLKPIEPAKEQKNTTEVGRTNPRLDDDPLPAIVTRAREEATLSAEPTSGGGKILIGVLGVLWFIGALLTVYFLYGFDSLGEMTPLELTALVGFIFLPLLFLVILFLTMKRLDAVTAQAIRLEQSANELMKVDDTVVRRATEMSGVIKGEINHINSGIDTALSRVSTLHNALGQQTEKLGETSLDVETRTQQITERLSTEREALWSISNTFQEQMKVLSETLDKHTEKLELSTKAAEQKIQEARVSVEATASKINQTSDLVRSNTMDAASTLTDNQNEILRLSEQLKSRANELDGIYQKHSTNLNAMIAQLRNEQEALSQTLEERLSKMRDVSLSAQVSAERLTEASEAGRKTVMSLSEAAKLSESAIKKRFSEMEDMVKFSNQRAESISEKASRRVQDSLAQTRKEIARIEADMMDLQTKMAQTTVKHEEDNTTIQSPSVENAEADITDIEVPPKKKRGSINVSPADDSEPSLRDSLRPSPQIDEEFIPAETKVETEALLELSDNSLELAVEAPETDAQDVNLRDELIQRTVDDRKPSGSWLKNLFGGKSEPSTSAIDALTAPAEPKSSPPAPSEQTTSDSPISETTLIHILSENGLSPAAIVDDGTVTEAASIRTSKGTKHMSLFVANRLKQPVEHLSKLMTGDPELRRKTVNFAVEYYHQLEPLSNDTDGLIKRLQSDEGRMFLLCDAALNN